jgi:hypothetical protein
LKPVIKKQTHYNVLLMRDDRESITFRIHCGLLRFCIGLFIALLLCGAGGIYGGLHFFTKYRELAGEQESRERENAGMRLQLERLVNLESLLKAGNGSPPQAKYTEVGTPDLPARNTAPANPPGPAASVRGAVPPAAGPSPPAESSAPDNDGENPAEETRNVPADAPASAPAADGKDPFISDANSPLRINEFSVRNAGSSRLRISYELSTTADAPRIVTGTARYAAVTGDGLQIELPLQDTESSRFAITRMKPMQNTVRLPVGLPVESVSTINILIEIADTVYRGSYPVRLQ